MHAASSSSSSRTQPGGVARAPIVLHRGRAGQFLHLLLLPRPSFVSQTEPIRRPTDRFGSVLYLTSFFFLSFILFGKGPSQRNAEGIFLSLFGISSLAALSFQLLFQVIIKQNELNNWEFEKRNTRPLSLPPMCLNGSDTNAVVCVDNRVAREILAHPKTPAVCICLSEGKFEFERGGVVWSAQGHDSGRPPVDNKLHSNYYHRVPTRH